jgi:hypothetical protein
MTSTRLEDLNPIRECPVVETFLRRAGLRLEPRYRTVESSRCTAPEPAHPKPNVTEDILNDGLRSFRNGRSD